MEKTFAKTVEELMDERDISINELASLTGMSTITLKKILNGEGKPRVNTIAMIAEALKVSFDWLYDIAEKEN